MAKNISKAVDSPQGIWSGTMKLFVLGMGLTLLTGAWMALMPAVTRLLPAPSETGLGAGSDGVAADAIGVQGAGGNLERPAKGGQVIASGTQANEARASRGGIRLEDRVKDGSSPAPRAAHVGKANIAPPTAEAVALLIDSATDSSGQGPKGQLGFTPDLSARSGDTAKPEVDRGTQAGNLERSRPDPTPYTVERGASQHGVEIAAAQAVAGGRFIDVRYRVVDPLKAVKMVYKGGETYMSDATGRRVSSRLMPKIGPAYVARHQAVEGSMYSAIFPNMGGEVKPGDFVTIGIGDLRVEQVRIQ